MYRYFVGEIRKEGKRKVSGKLRQDYGLADEQVALCHLFVHGLAAEALGPNVNICQLPMTSKGVILCSNQLCNFCRTQN